ncbi:hypothetical protein [Cellulomonas flavigena]|uniref:hypothetical protein n=1 Tax=Cellulomonas flavigena TaxID=1711 RepID=UPI0011D21061|nr:hypothetical protein [Cellulomonas flavigena]
MAVAVITVVVVAVACCAEARIGPRGTELGLVLGRYNPGVLSVSVPDGALPVVALALMCVPVTLAAIGRRATRGRPTTSRCTGAAAVVTVVVAPVIVVTAVATALGAADSDWMVAALIWPQVSAVVAVIAVAAVGDSIRPRRPSPRI